MTTVPFGWVMANHGTGTVYSSPIPWFILMNWVCVFRCPHSNMYRRTSSAMASLPPVGLPVAHRGVEDVPEVVLGDIARGDDQQPLLLHRAVDERRHVVLGVAELGDAAGRLDVAHELADDVGQRVRPRVVER